jgi:hypothetical protein
MKLSVRPLEPEDFDECWAMSTLREKFSAEDARRFRAAWAYLLPRDEIFGAVVEDVSGGGRRLLAFGANVFVTDGRMAELRSCPKPFAVTQVLLEAGKPDSSILNQRQIGLYNAQGGLNVVVVHRGEFARKPPPGIRWEEFFLSRDSEEFSRTVERIVWAFQEVNRGFRLREMLCEGYGPFEMQWSLSGGNWKLRSDYAEYYSRSAECFPSQEEHPYLVGATKGETAVNAALWSMFQASPPVLGFSARQKRVFLQAVRGYSNESIAARLGINEESVHSCFRMGYDKVREHPVLGVELQDEAQAEAGKDRSRKRDRFVELLRTHPEELRPWSTNPVLRRMDIPVFSVSAG